MLSSWLRIVFCFGDFHFILLRLFIEKSAFDLLTLRAEPALTFWPKASIGNNKILQISGTNSCKFNKLCFEDD
jgi:hypothetical protein